MDTVVVAGIPGSYAPGLAERLTAALGPAANVLVSTAPGVEPAALAVFVDDVPEADGEGSQRAVLLAAFAARRARGEAIAVVHSRKESERLTAALRESGLPPPPGPLRRVFVASGHSEHSHEEARRIARALGLPFVEPEPPGADSTEAGWGPRYAEVARAERWLAHTHVWHAVEALAEAADLVLHFEPPPPQASDEFPAPAPKARTWRMLFAPWLRRYPRFEAQLLARELAAHAGDVPVLHLRTEAEATAVIAAFERTPVAPTG